MNEETTTQEPTRVITVRLPKSLHLAIRNEAWRQHKSMNQLCVELIQEATSSQAGTQEATP